MVECSNNPLNPIPPGQCAVYIGVYGYNNASFSIVAYVGAGSSALELLDGIPQAGSVTEQGLSYFYADVDLPPPGTTYSFYVRSLSGDPDLFVTTDGTLPVVCCPPHYQYSSMSSTGDDYVNVARGTSGYNATTRAYALVHGFTASTFEITFATVGAVEPLSDSVSTRGVGVGDQNLYYFFSIPDPSTLFPVTISCTALSGDPDLFISVSAVYVSSFFVCAAVRKYARVRKKAFF